MVIGGDTDDSWTDDIELISLDSKPVPECLTNLNPFTYGTIFNSVGATLASGMSTYE